MKHDILKAAKQLQRDVQKHRWAERKRKKDAVLHLRIEGGVMNRIKAEAASREMSVSDVIRCYLAERFAEAGAGKDTAGFLLVTLAFSDVIIMKDGRCAACDGILPRGTKARLAHGPFPQPRLVCGNCHDAFQRQFDGQHGPSSGEE